MNPFYVGGIIGFAPALFLIWFCLRKYTYPFVEGSLFEDRRVFFMLAVGMVLGSLIFVFEQYLATLYTYDGGIDFIMFMLIFVLAFPLIEDMAKFVILNFKGYEGRFDSTFYGISLGAGYAATSMIGYVLLLMTKADREGVSVSNEIWLGIIFFSICTAFIHCSVGATLGNATGKKLGLRGLPQAVVPHFVFNLLLFPWFVYDQIWYSLIFVIPVSFIIFYGVYKYTIPEAMPKEVQKEMRRNERKKTN
jgi:RsiW-degrading membrane proteinase PrsW (M82 family)